MVLIPKQANTISSPYWLTYNNYVNVELLDTELQNVELLNVELLNAELLQSKFGIFSLYALLCLRIASFVTFWFCVYKINLKTILKFTNP